MSAGIDDILTRLQDEDVSGADRMKLLAALKQQKVSDGTIPEKIVVEKNYADTLWKVSTAAQ